MQKPDSLRAAIVAMLPYLARDPDRLVMWIDRGSIAARLTGTLGFRYSYRLNVVIENLTVSPSVAMLAVIKWLTENEPALLTPNKDAVAFEADILDNGTIDLQLLLDLTEQVLVTAKDDGGYDIAHPPEPFPLLPDDLGAGGLIPIPTLSSLWTVDGEKILPDVPPFGADVQD